MFISSRWQKERKKEIENLQSKIKNLEKRLYEGRKYRIQYIASKYNQGTENFEGILIKKMGRYLVFRSVLGYTECFLKVDFIIGQYHIEEVR
ncbi:hypothetical protein [Tepidimicrobium xylanilyticum]